MYLFFVYLVQLSLKWKAWCIVRCLFSLWKVEAAVKIANHPWSVESITYNILKSLFVAYSIYFCMWLGAFDQKMLQLRTTKSEPLDYALYQLFQFMYYTKFYLQCSVSCGEGTRHRNVTCTTLKDKFPDTACDSQMKPSSVVACKMQNCHTGFDWKAEKWSEVRNKYTKNLTQGIINRFSGKHLVQTY